MAYGYFTGTVGTDKIKSYPKFENLFCNVLIYSGVPQNHAEILSKRLLSVYQGELLLGRISGDISYLENARKNMIEMYREYRTFRGI